MSFLVRYTLKSADDHAHQIKAMETLVADLKSEGIAGLNYACFSTGDPVEFIGVLEFDSDATKEKFLASGAFATYREKVGPTFANPPTTTDITGIASTKA
jgi:hypothetical protein